MAKVAGKSVEVVAVTFLVLVLVVDKLGFFLSPASADPGLFGEAGEEAVARGSVVTQLTGLLCAIAAIVVTKFWVMWRELKQDKQLLLYLLFLFTGLLYSISPGLTIRRLALFVVVLVIAFSLRQSLHGPFDGALRVLYTFCLSYFTITLIAVARSVAQGHSFLSVPFTVFDAAHRDAEILAIFLILHWYYSGTSARRPPLTRIVIWWLAPAAILLTLSRTTIVALVVVFVYLAILGSRAKTMIAFQSLLFVGVATATVMVVPPSTLDMVVRPETVGTLTGRTIMWDFLFAGGMVDPLFGAGFGAFWNSDTIYALQNIYGWGITGAHNGFFDAYLNTGIIGLGIIVIILITLWKRTGYLNFRQKAVARALLIFILVQNMAQGSFQNPKHFVEITLWLLYTHVLNQTATVSEVVQKDQRVRENA